METKSASERLAIQQETRICTEKKIKYTYVEQFTVLVGSTHASSY